MQPESDSSRVPSGGMAAGSGESHALPSFSVAHDRLARAFPAYVLDDFVDYLVAHESDIVWQVEDFGRLATVFVAVMGRVAQPGPFVNEAQHRMWGARCEHISYIGENQIFLCSKFEEPEVVTAPIQKEWCARCGFHKSVHAVKGTAFEDW